MLDKMEIDVPEHLSSTAIGGEEGVSVVSADSSSLDPNEPVVEQWLLQEGVRVGTMLSSVIHELDLMILEGKRVLEAAQPSVAGKISVRWWVARSGNGREPYVFRWKQRRDGKWKAENLVLSNLAKRAQRAGIFATGAGVTEIALSELQGLIETRKELLAAFGRARQILSNKVNGAQRRLEKSGGVLRGALAEAEEIRAERPPLASG